MIARALVFALALALPAGAEVLMPGSGKDTYNLVIVGDGWADMKGYQDAVEDMVDGLFEMDPFKHYKDTFRVTRLDVASPQQGCRFNFPPRGKTWTEAQKKDYTSRITPIGVVWRPVADESKDGPELSEQSQKKLDALIGDIPCRVAIVLTPDTEVNNGIAHFDKQRSYIVMNNVNEKSLGDRKGTLAHELGHALFYLEDEYCKKDVDFDRPNIDVISLAEYVKWKHLTGLLGPPKNTCADGAKKPAITYYYSGTFCRMNDAQQMPGGYPNYFCLVCKDAIRGHVQSHYRLIHSYSPVKYTVEVPAMKSATFKVKLRPLGDELMCFWMLDGHSLGPGTITKAASGWTVEKTIGTMPGSLTPGTHRVRFLVEDGHNDVVGTGALPTTQAPQSVEWQIEVIGALGKPITLGEESAWD